MVTETKRATEIQTNLLKNKEWAPTIKACSKKGSYEWLIGNRKIIPSHIYTLNIMSRLKISHPQLPNSLLCPGCKKLLSSSEALAHIPGCVKCAGHNVTTKHHALVRYLYELCLRAGLPCEREPRQFSYYECSACAATIHPENKTEHARTCVGSCCCCCLTRLAMTGYMFRVHPSYLVLVRNGTGYYRTPWVVRCQSRADFPART